MIKRVFNFLGSLRVTLALILALSFVFLLGLWIPQKSVLQFDLYLQWQAKSPSLVSILDAVGLTDIYTSRLTLALWTLFFLNLAVVMVRRIPAVRSKISLSAVRTPDPVSDPAYSQKTVVPLPAGTGTGTAQRILSGSGFRCQSSAAGFSAVRNRLSPVATLLFHLSFFLMLLGGVISVYTRFSGTVDLAEGETFQAGLAQYNPGSRLPKMGTLPSSRFVIEKIEPQMTAGVPNGLRVTLADANAVRHVIEVNRPFKSDDTFFVIRNLGVAPLVVVSDRRGELDGAYVKLNVLKGKQDAFEMAGLTFAADFYPDHVVAGGKDLTRSEELKNPVFRFYVRKGQSSVAQKLIRAGEEASFGKYRIEIRELPYWVRLYVVKEQGVWIIYAGFVLATSALIWRLVFYRREIIGIVRQENGQELLYLAGRAEFFKLLFEDEFNELSKKLHAAS